MAKYGNPGKRYQPARRRRILSGEANPDGVFITDQPDTWSGAEGDTATFTVAATSGDASPLTYQWKENAGGWVDVVNGGRVSGATTATLTITPVEVGDYARKFLCVVSNDTNSVWSSSATLILNAAIWYIMDEVGNRVFDEDPGYTNETIDERSTT